MVELGLVTSHTDCGVPGNWFSQATGFPHDGSAAVLAEDADATGPRIVRADDIIIAAATAVTPKDRHRPRVLMRANGALELARATTLITAPPKPLLSVSTGGATRLSSTFQHSQEDAAE